MHHAHPACRACGQLGLVPVVSLGHTPLASRLLSAPELECDAATYPLDLVVCPSCALVQIAEIAAEECAIDQQHEDQWIDDADELAAETIADRHLNCRDLVIQVASGDGQLLEQYQRADVPVLGIETSTALAQAARRKREVPTLVGHFSRDLALRLEACSQSADVVHVHHALAGVTELSCFVAGLRAVLKPEGMAIVEVPYVRDLVENVEFSQIDHEHVCYFSLLSLSALLGRHGMLVTDAEHRMGFGTLRVTTARQGASSPAVARLLAEEKSLGMSRPEYYRDFGRRVDQIRTELKSLCSRLKQQGHRIVGYGASPKASGMLNACGLGPDVIDFVVDRSSAKQGHFIPGSHLAIYSPDKLAEARPDYALVLDWHAADEILARHERYRSSGGHFIIPLPQLRVA